jgi:hypothetical protein
MTDTAVGMETKFHVGLSFSVSLALAIGNAQSFVNDLDRLNGNFIAF